MGESIAVTTEMMTEAEARSKVKRVQRALEDARSDLLDLYERRGWKALGYPSWAACVQQEFGGGRTALYQELDAARTERVLFGADASAIADAKVPESHLRPLASIAAVNPEEARALWQKVQETAPNGTVTAAHVTEVVDKHAVHYSSESTEWYTPPDMWERASRVMCGIDLDPCADPGRRVAARRHFTVTDDGLAQDWGTGSVWMNPPYGRGESGVAGWVPRFIAHIAAGNDGMALLPARTDTDWFQPLFSAHLAFCFIDGRLKFSGHTNSAPFPSVIVYGGDNLLGFFEEFQTLGGMVMPWRPDDAPGPEARQEEWAVGLFREMTAMARKRER